ncbi:MAG: methyltransferase [Propionibacteriaceae bacterium]|nr:methyltransferase [Propionibacteriaceae bacterium]
MFLTIESPGDELSYLLFKHPDRVQSFELPVGRATVFYPRADQAVTTVALSVEVDAVGLARSKRFKVSGFELGHYVNDRAYAASSLLAVALGRVFRSALAGRDALERPGAAGRPRRMTIHLPSVRSRGGTALVRELFEPLGWAVESTETAPSCVDVRLGGELTLAHALSQLYVLLPVLDDSKHYWVGEAEIDKLVRYGADWLTDHPARATIMARYLAHQGRYVVDAAARLAGGTLDQDSAELADRADPVETAAELDQVPVGLVDSVEAAENAADLSYPADLVTDAMEDAAPRPRTETLAGLRTRFLVDQLRRLGACRVLDLGCGEGRLVRALLDYPQFEVVGADVAASPLAQAARRLERIADRQRQRVRLIQASATYRDDRFLGFDAVVVSEVIEHLDLDRLEAFERNLFLSARPQHVLITTPNAEYNQLYGLATGQSRHSDHRFEWTRRQFQDWAQALARRTGYSVRFDGVGSQDQVLGQPTQVAIFERGGEV